MNENNVGIKAKNNKNPDAVRMTSIARKINFYYVRNRFLEYIFIDVLLVAILAAIFVVVNDKQQMGAFSNDYIRQIRYINTNHAILYGDLYDNMQNIVYIVSDRDNGFLYEIPMGDWLYFGYYGAVVLVVVELFNVVVLMFKGTKKVRRKLKPLNQIAKRAAQLSNMTFDETKYHNLETEISKLEVDAMENGIHMHDKELEGIETALNGLLDRIRASYKQQSQFVSDASHELRTPIAVIRGYVNMLDRWGKEDAEILDESILAIKNEADHMQKLVEQLLFLARGDSNRQSFDMKEYNLNSIIREVYEESVMIDMGHTYIYEENGTAQIYCDIDMLKQSARILIDNAAKYTKEGEEIIIKTGLWKDGSPYYQVQDNGIGMEEGDVEHAFDRFYRADSVRNSSTGGTGLGLSIAKWIVDKHKGYYDIVSRKGLGTRFSVIFPQTQESSNQ
jgi:signal transduction histidine kinase